jgi:predicted nucleotidyltransferase
MTDVSSDAERVVVEAFDGAFPGRVRAYYVSGSQANGSAVRTSDLDLTVIFQETTDPDEERRAAGLSERLSSESAIELDIDLTDEGRVSRNAPPWLVLGSRRVAGEDIRDRMRLMPIEEWARDRMHTSYWRLATLFGRAGIVTPPVEYPDVADPYRGYLRRTVRLADGSRAPSSRDLIRHVGWAATAIIALRAGEYVPSKRECHVVYRRVIGDEWSGLLAEIYDLCRGEWKYLVPDGEMDRRRLRGICERVLAFENHFLRLYIDFLREELRGSPEVRRTALQALERAPLSSLEVTEKIRQVLELRPLPPYSSSDAVDGV